MPDERMVDTPHGVARVVLGRARRPVATLVLSHGAGGGIEAPDLQALAELLPRHRISTYLVEQPWRVAGGKIAPRPQVLDECLIAVVSGLRRHTPLVLGGRSAGARSSVRQAEAVGAAACLALAFPLHPPGRPERSRLAELQDCPVPALVVQGERDPFGRPEEFPAGTPMVVIPSANHGFAVPKSAELQPPATYQLIATTARDWLLRDVL